MENCKVKNCSNSIHCKSLCCKHYMRYRLKKSFKGRDNEYHGMSNTREYKAWQAMKKRCNEKNNINYGGRGIKVCDEWRNSFLTFYNDMGDIPEGMSLDRIDVNGNYDPSNCRWATYSEQNINKRISKNNKTGYKGISYVSSRKKYRVDININGKSIYIGMFTTIKDALNAKEKYVRT